MFVHRVASLADTEALRAVMREAIGELQKPFLTPEQIAASRLVMGLDTQLIEDGTYFVVHSGHAIAGCGGWSRRATLFGGDHTAGRDDALLNPATQAARVRAMYTAPAYVRRGVGRLILGLCEAAALQEGFQRMELAGTLAGLPLYEACGYRVVERFVTQGVPLARMEKTLVS